MERTRFSKIFAAFILSAGLIVSGYLVSNSLLKAKLLDRTVVVKGLAEKEVKADLAIWPISITATGDNLSEVNKKIESDRTIIINFLIEQGFNKNEITTGDYKLTDLMATAYRAANAENARYIISASVILKTTNVLLVDKVSKNKNLLVQKGLVLGGVNDRDEGDPYYEITQFNEIKPEMLSQAIKNARLSAEQFAKDSGSEVGILKKANQGVFLISSASQSSNEEYINPQAVAKSIYKKIRVVTTLEYFLK